eukprot:2691725-Pyramimonas_sp.AAC.1
MSGWSPTDRVLLMSRCHLAGLRGATRGAQDEPDLLVPHQAALPAAARAEGAKTNIFGRAKTPTWPRHRLQTANQSVRYVQGVRRFAERSPATNDGDVQDSKKLGSVWSTAAWV